MMELLGQCRRRASRRSGMLQEVLAKHCDWVAGWLLMGKLSGGGSVLNNKGRSNPRGVEVVSRLNSTKLATLNGVKTIARSIQTI